LGSAGVATGLFTGSVPTDGDAFTTGRLTARDGGATAGRAMTTGAAGGAEWPAVARSGDTKAVEGAEGAGAVDGGALA